MCRGSVRVHFGGVVVRLGIGGGGAGSCSSVLPARRRHGYWAAT